MRPKKWEYFLLAGIVGVYLVLTIYHLRGLPAEWYGDISIEHRQVLAILRGGFPWQFHLSAGPAYHYIVAAFALLFGPNYETYKIASVITGLMVVPLVYWMGVELRGVRLGLLAALVAATSFWLILFARLGSSPQILSPVLAAGSVLFLLRFARTKRWSDAILSMFLADWGLFTYPSTFVLPVTVLGLIALQWLFAGERRLWWRAFLVSALVLLPFVAWFAFTVETTPAFSQGGYVGSKVIGGSESPQTLLIKSGKNMLVALGMFQWTGDHAFRTNASGQPMLDPLSGVMMDLGLVWLFVDKRLRQRWAFILVPVVILVMPSASPGIPAIEIPSASRAFGAAPFVSLTVAFGLDALWTIVPCLLSKSAALIARLRTRVNRLSSLRIGDDASSRSGRWSFSSRLRLPDNWQVLSAGILVGIILLLISYFNIHKYFIVYAWGLPEHNQPWGLEIAQYIDSLPPDVEVRLTGCCWGNWSQPEPEGIYYVLQHPQDRKNLLSSGYVKNCSDLQAGKPYALILSPYNPRKIDGFKSCFPQAQGQMHYDPLGQEAFYTLLIR